MSEALDDPLWVFDGLSIRLSQIDFLRKYDDCVKIGYGRGKNTYSLFTPHPSVLLLHLQGKMTDNEEYLHEESNA